MVYNPPNINGFSAIIITLYQVYFSMGIVPQKNRTPNLRHLLVQDLSIVLG